MKTNLKIAVVSLLLFYWVMPLDCLGQKAQTDMILYVEGMPQPRLGDFVSQSMMKIYAGAHLDITEDSCLISGRYKYNIISNGTMKDVANKYELHHMVKGSILNFSKGKGALDIEYTKDNKFYSSQVIITAFYDSCVRSGRFSAVDLKRSKEKRADISEDFPYFVRELSYGKRFYMFISFDNKEEIKKLAIKNEIDWDINIKKIADIAGKNDLSALYDYFAKNYSATIIVEGIANIKPVKYTTTIKSVADLDNALVNFQKLFTDSKVGLTHFFISDVKNLGRDIFPKSNAFDLIVNHEIECLIKKTIDIQDNINRLRQIQDLQNEADDFPVAIDREILQNGNRKVDAALAENNKKLELLREEFSKSLKSKKWHCIDTLNSNFPRELDKYYKRLIASKLSINYNVTHDHIRQGANILPNTSFELYSKSTIKCKVKIRTGPGGNNWSECDYANWHCEDNGIKQPCKDFALSALLVEITGKEHDMVFNCTEHRGAKLNEDFDEEIIFEHVLPGIYQLFIYPSMVNNCAAKDYHDFSLKNRSAITVEID